MANITAKAVCTKCGKALREGAKFCDGCGASAQSVCSKCKVILRPGAKFCDECGTPVGAPAPAAEKPAVINNIHYAHTSYDFIDNGNGELMMVMDIVEGEPDEEKAKFIYDGFSEAMLIRNKGQIVHLPIIVEAVREMLEELETLLITEMDGEEIADVYEAPIEIINDSLPLPKEVYDKMILQKD
jgi:RNA polymerase subunit RPABC4/transcription elongation factor Spt4